MKPRKDFPRPVLSLAPVPPFGAPLAARRKPRANPSTKGPSSIDRLFSLTCPPLSLGCTLVHDKSASLLTRATANRHAPLWPSLMQPVQSHFKRRLDSLAPEPVLFSLVDQRFAPTIVTDAPRPRLSLLLLRDQRGGT